MAFNYDSKGCLGHDNESLPITALTYIAAARRYAVKNSSQRTVTLQRMENTCSPQVSDSLPVTRTT